jgi:hypothetical protein
MGEETGSERTWNLPVDTSPGSGRIWLMTGLTLGKLFAFPIREKREALGKVF